MANFAAELGVPIGEAASLFREIQGCVMASATTSVSTGTGGGGSCGSGSGQRRGGTNSIASSASELVASQSLAAGLLGTASASSSANASIITFSRHVDQLLGGGIPVGSLTEVYGMPGCGKTQLAMQIAVNTVLPAQFGGVEGETLYIDTEGSFSPERCHDMADALVRHIHAGVARKNRRDNNGSAGSTTAPAFESVPAWFNVDSIMERIYVYRIHDLAAQTSLLQALPQIVSDITAFTEADGTILDSTSAVATTTTQQQLLQQIGKSRPRHRIKLIVIDSMAFHYRAAAAETSATSTAGSAGDYIERARMLTAQANELADLASRESIAVLVVNQMTTKIVASGAGGPGGANRNGTTNEGKIHTGNGGYGSNSGTMSKTVPALGESWAHAVTTRIGLSMSAAAASSRGTNTRRTLNLVKSPRLPSGSADFVIVNDGIRGKEYVEKRQMNHVSSSSSNNKKPKTAS